MSMTSTVTPISSFVFLTRGDDEYGDGDDGLRCNEIPLLCLRITAKMVFDRCDQRDVFSSTLYVSFYHLWSSNNRAPVQLTNNDDGSRHENVTPRETVTVSLFATDLTTC